MKNSTYIFVIVMTILIGLLLSDYPKQSPYIPTAPQKIVSTCYTWDTPLEDRANLRINVSTDNQVSGYFNYIPKEKDKKTGNFNGTITDLGDDTQQANLTWNVSAEGTLNREELIIKISNHRAQPGFGEMRDRGNGTYIYTNPELLSYSILLEEIPCDKK